MGKEALGQWDKPAAESPGNQRSLARHERAGLLTVLVRPGPISSNGRPNWGTWEEEFGGQPKSVSAVSKSTAGVGPLNWLALDKVATQWKTLKQPGYSSFKALENAMSFEIHHKTN